MITDSKKWIIQRITAVLLIPLTFWFVYHCVLFSKFNYEYVVNFFNSYLNSFLFLLMMISMLIHAKFGCETIVEDYISVKTFKNVIILFINIIIYLAISISLISIFIIQS